MSLKEIKALRKELHKYPELSGLESKTSFRIKKFIETHHNSLIIDHLGGHGLAAVYKYSDDGPVIVIRCELDALPIEESMELNYKSVNPGVSHKCGHDGHMAIVAGLLFWLKIRAFKTGQIILLFQPAEETGAGAAGVLNDQRFSNLNPDYIFSLHNIPGQPLHSVIVTKDKFCAAVQSVIISICGKESHSAQPENGNNPALCMAELIQVFDRINNHDLSHQDFALFVPVYSKMGKKSYGISAGFGEIHYTLRTWSSEKMNSMKTEVESIILTISQKHQLSIKTEWIDYFPPVINDDYCSKVIAQTAKELDLEIVEKQYPFRFGEDFGWFSQKYNAAMFGLGAGVDSPGLHQPEYDFPDELIHTGMDMFKGIIEFIMNESNIKNER